MADKSDEEIIKEVGLEASDELNEQETLDQLSLTDDKDENLLSPINERDKDSKNRDDNVIENEDRDGIEKTKKGEDTIEENSEPVQKKQPKIYKILLSLAAFLILILITGGVLYLTGFFDSKPIQPIEKKTVTKNVVEEIDFDTNEINKKRLNKKLTSLTKHEIMNKEELESEENKIKEEERKKKEAEEKERLEKKQKEEALVAAQLVKLEEEKKALENQQKIIKEEQEKFLQLQIQAKEELAQAQAKLLEELNNTKGMSKNKQEQPYANETTEAIEELSNQEEDLINNSFLSFINVATIKGELYKSYLDKAQKHYKNISICRDNKNRIEIYFGPFYSSKERKKVFDNLLEDGFKESYLIDFTNEEYNKRCKY